MEIRATGESKPFLTDIQTPGYRADRPVAIRLLNEALATEIICVLRYKRHYFLTQGLHAESVAEKFLEQANEEQEHADRIAIDSYGEIISYLGDSDSTTRRMMEDILAVEEEHAEDLVSLLEDTVR